MIAGGSAALPRVVSQAVSPQISRNALTVVAKPQDRKLSVLSLLAIKSEYSFSLSGELYSRQGGARRGRAPAAARRRRRDRGGRPGAAPGTSSSHLKNKLSYKGARFIATKLQFCSQRRREQERC